jgi:hypothetical protein
MILQEIQNKINSITSRLARYDNLNGAFGDVLINDVIETVRWLAELQSSGEVEAYVLENIERSDKNKVWQNIIKGVATDLSRFLNVCNEKSKELSQNNEYRARRAEIARERLTQQFVEVVDDVEASQRNFIINSAGEWWESLENEVETLLTILEKYTGIKQHRPGDKPQLPKELDTPEGREFLESAIKFGVMDKNFQLIESTHPKQALFAEAAAEYLNFDKLPNRPKYKPFEKLWEIKVDTLKTYHYKSTEISGIVRGAEKINSFFAGLGINMK